ncbi:zinc finger protein 362a isoform X3 [Brienomyrus brachyistius]|nr:zinc finger protein 362a isoform X3 [Brienomyrus brachyistius]XP_048879484.1 zinc finger protein 362a isoform X3 [Brienomyrus brachyistius]XP_048879485.1 zinc finger protein 362a isoform X3 [Brienomyrus brachyistius]
MAEPRFNNPYFWPPPPAMPGQLDNLVLINKIKEQLMAEKIRPPHLPPTTLPSQQPLLVAPSSLDGGQHAIPVPKFQQVPALHSHSPSQPDLALHTRPTSSTVSGLSLASRTSEATTPTTPTSSIQSRMGGAASPNIISGLASHPSMESFKNCTGLAGLLGPPPKMERGRKKIKAENPSGPLLVVPYPILTSGIEGTIPMKEGKIYRCKVCPLTFFSKSDMQIHSKSHTEAKPHKCPHCSKSFANASYLAQHLRIHLGVKPYHCSYCEKSFRQLSHLQQHTRIHTGDRPYKCAHPGCEKAFTQLSNLQSHQRQHNKDKPYKCPNCYRAYSDSASLQRHLSAHAIKNAKAYCCSVCGRAYTSVSMRPGAGFAATAVPHQKQNNNWHKHETYLMKHMSKHTVVEHLVTHHSPQRTESPSLYQWGRVGTSKDYFTALSGQV